MVVLKKKFELVAGVSDLTTNEFILDARKKAQSEIDFPLLVPGIAPTGASVITAVDEMQTQIDERAMHVQAAKTCTKGINEKRRAITKTLTDQWPPKIAAAIGEDAEKASTLGYAVKWLDGGHSPDEPSILNSHPNVPMVEKHNHLEDKITVTNSKSGTTAQPWDVRLTNLFEWVGPNPPANVKLWRYLGVFKNGAFLNHHDPADLDKEVHYVAEYIPKDEANTPELGGVVKSTII